MNFKPSYFLTPRVGRVATWLVIAGLSYLVIDGLILPWLEIRSDIVAVMPLSLVDELKLFAKTIEPTVLIVGITLAVTAIFAWRLGARLGGPDQTESLTLADEESDSAPPRAD